jgi:CheY-like chemotaxis protein
MALGQVARVLVVDDHMDAAETLATLLQLWGHHSCLAHDGTGALQAVTAFQPDVVLLDIGLPGMDGYQVAQQLRECPGMEKAVLVAMTGYGGEEDHRRSQEAGIDYHLVKPVDLEVLQELLARSESLAR